MNIFLSIYKKMFTKKNKLLSIYKKWHYTFTNFYRLIKKRSATL